MYSGTTDYLRIGAGGMVTAIDVAQDGTMIAGTDTSGTYVYDLFTSKWRVSSTSESMGSTARPGNVAEPGASGVAVCATDSTRMYQAMFGKVWRSDDSGVKWRATALPEVLMQPNNLTRDRVVRLVVDPIDPDHVLYGSLKDGLYRTVNGGDNWVKVAGITPVYAKWNPSTANGQGYYNSAMWTDGAFSVAGMGVSQIVFDHTSQPIGGHTSKIYVGVQGQGIFRSLNGGTTWSLLESGPYTMTPESMTIDTGVLYFTSPRQTYGVSINATGGTYTLTINGNTTGTIAWNDPVVAQTAINALGAPYANALVVNQYGGKYGYTYIVECIVDQSISILVNDAGLTGPSKLGYAEDITHTNLGGRKSAWYYDYAGNWVNVTPDEWSTGDLKIAADPRNLGRLVLTQSGAFNAPRLMQATTDSGTTWTTMEGNRTATQDPADVPWMAARVTSDPALWMSMIRPFWYPPTPNVLMLAEGFGVWRVDIASTAPNAASIWRPQGRGIEQLVGNDILAQPDGSVLAAGWDCKVFRQTSRASYPTTYLPNLTFGSCWSLARARNTDTFVAASFANHQDGTGVAQSGYSTDNGATWTAYAALPAGSTNAYDTWGFGQIVASSPTNHLWVGPDNRGAYYTTNQGSSWTAVSLPGGAVVGNAYTHNVWQAQAVNRRPACSDSANTFYMYVRDYGIYRTTDGGATWTQRCNQAALPESDYWWSVHMYATPGKTGELWLTCGRTSVGDEEVRTNKVIRSNDGGVTWSTVPHLGSISAIGWGAVMPGKTDRAMLAVGNYDEQHAVVFSDDGGTTWQVLQDWPNGQFATIKAIDGDSTVAGRFFLATDGAGYLQFDAALGLPTVRGTATIGTPALTGDVWPVDPIQLVGVTTPVYVTNTTDTYEARIPYPANTKPGDLLVLVCGMKTAAAPSADPGAGVVAEVAWDERLGNVVGGGYGATHGNNTGDTLLSVWTRLVGESGEPTDVGCLLYGNNVAWFTIMHYRTKSKSYAVLAAKGQDTTGNASFGATMETSMDVRARDELIAFGVIPTDVTTPAQFSSHAFTSNNGTTVAVASEITELDSSANNKIGGVIARTSVTGTGTGEATITYTATTGGTVTNARGPVGVLRIRPVRPAVLKRRQTAEAVTGFGASSITGTFPIPRKPNTFGLVAVAFSGDPGAVATPEGWLQLAFNRRADISVWVGWSTNAQSVTFNRSTATLNGDSLWLMEIDNIGIPAESAWWYTTATAFSDGVATGYSPLVSNGGWVNQHLYTPGVGVYIAALENSTDVPVTPWGGLTETERNIQQTSKADLAIGTEWMVDAATEVSPLLWWVTPEKKASSVVLRVAKRATPATVNVAVTTVRGTAMIPAPSLQGTARPAPTTVVGVGSVSTPEAGEVEVPVPLPLYAGVNYAGAEFSDTVLPGTPGTDFWYPTSASIAYLASRGYSAFRLPILWERIQPLGMGVLDSGEASRLMTAVQQANANGLTVVVGIHNYGRYHGVPFNSGDSGAPTAAMLADCYVRIADLLEGCDWIVGMMNEPHDIPGSAPTFVVGNNVALWDSGTTLGWNGENCTLAYGTGTVHQGAGSLSVTRTDLVNGDNNFFRFNIADDGLTATNGNTLSAWVYVPEGATGTSWVANIEMQNSSWSWQAGPQITVPKGTWTQITYQPPSGTWAGHKAIGVQLRANGVSNASATVYVDTFTQGENVGGATEAEAWEIIAHDVAVALRTAGVTQEIYVPVYEWAHIQGAPERHSGLPARFAAVTDWSVEVHHYWDGDYSGVYWRNWAQEIELAGTQGWSAGPEGDAVVTRTLAHLDAALAWAEAGGFKLVIGELGWPENDDAAHWQNVATKYMYRVRDSQNADYYGWAAGDHWGSYPLAIYDVDGSGSMATPNMQAPLLEPQAAETTNRTVVVAPVPGMFMVGSPQFVEQATDDVVVSGTVPGTGIIGTPTIITSVNRTVTPSTVQGAVTIGVPSIQRGATVTPATVQRPVTIPGSVIVRGTTVTPATVARTVVIGTPVIVAGTGALVPSTTVQRAVVIGAPVILRGTTTQTTGTVQATGSVGTPVVIFGTSQYVTPQTVIGRVAINAPGIQSQGNANVGATTVAGVTTIGAAVLHTGVTIVPATVQRVVVIGAPILQTGSGVTVTTTTVMGTASVAAPVVQAEAVVLAPTVLGAVTIGVPAILYGNGIVVPSQTVSGTAVIGMISFQGHVVVVPGTVTGVGGPGVGEAIVNTTAVVATVTAVSVIGTPAMDGGVLVPQTTVQGRSVVGAPVVVAVATAVVAVPTVQGTAHIDMPEVVARTVPLALTVPGHAAIGSPTISAMQNTTVLPETVFVAAVIAQVVFFYRNLEVRILPIESRIVVRRIR